jgi:hypothetical protein
MPKAIHQKLLLVEGADELRTIPEFIKANGIVWEPQKDVPIVQIKDCKGYARLSNPIGIKAELSAADRTALGILLDADEDPINRWLSIRNACRQSIPDLPDDLPETGLIHQAYSSSGNPIKFGIWMMPDNQRRGMLETFLACLVRDEQDELWRYAQETAEIAKTKGASWKEVHRDKANIHTWLAWQDPTGCQIHQAITKRILDPKHPRSQSFVTWFRKLYSL